MRSKKGRATPGELRRVVRLGLCLLIFLSAFVVKTALGKPLSELRGALTRDMDFVSAFSAAGEALDGGATLTQTAQGLYSDIFGRGETPARAVLAAFKESQQEFSQLETPPNVDISKRETGFGTHAPVNGEVSDSFGYRVHPVSGLVAFHYGVDLQTPEGTPVSAFADGTVDAVGSNTTDGIYVRITHEGGFSSYCCHLSSVSVAPGDRVALGDGVGLSGATGNATGPCLHLEVWDGDVCLNPAYYI